MTILDAAWLGLVAPAFYKKHLGHLMAPKANRTAAVIFYLVFILGIAAFVIYPGWIEHRSLLAVAGKGALFGLVTYGTYDLTNHATLKNWPKIVTIVDMTWGAVITTATSVVSVSILSALIK